MKNNNYKKKFRTLYSNLSDHRNYELRFAILNNDILPEELVKMQSEELAPSSLKSRRTERQNKYFKEQVLMKEETKIIAKTHKGESILTFDKEIINENFFMPQTDLSVEKIGMTENSHEKSSGIYYSDNDEVQVQVTNSRENSNLIKNSIILNKTAVIPPLNINEVTNFPKKDSTVTVTTATSLKKTKPIKYNNLSQEKLNFYNFLEEYKRENLIAKFNDKLKMNLKQLTQLELMELREPINITK